MVSAHVASQPVQGSGQRLEVYGREGTLVVDSNESRLLGARAGETALEELPIPEHLTWVPAEVPEGPAFNVAQMYRRFRRGHSVR